MKLTRRNFIKASGAAAVSAPLLLGSVTSILGQVKGANDLFPIPFESTSDPVNFLTAKYFEPFLNGYMQVQARKARPVWIQLVDVKQLSRPINEERGFKGESFSLLFRGPDERALLSGVYTFQHAALGKFSLFLSPVGQAGDSYEAVVNRIGR